MPNSILVIQTAFIGDVVLATAVAEKLHDTYPHAAIDFLVRKGNEHLLKNNPNLREILVWDKSKNKILNLIALLNKIRSNHYNTIVNIQRFAATGFLTAFSGAAERIGFDQNPLSFLFDRSIPHTPKDSPPLHELDRNQQLIEHLTGKIPARPRLYPSDTDYHAVKAWQEKPYLCIAPASVWQTKQYPADKWISFINQIPETYQILLIAGPGDAALCNQIMHASDQPARIHNLAGKLSLLQSAALQQGAAMNFVNDSAPLHFASAMNAPVTAIFCSTIPAFGYGPRSDDSSIIETTMKLPCRPCGIHGKKTCPEKHFHCARQITDAQLLARIP